MGLQPFFDQFALISDAPNGILKLRELILRLAVQGQLNTQNKADEPASALLRRIQKHRTQLIEDKRIKNSKLLPAIDSTEIPFDIPPNWIWIRLGEIGDWGAGATPDRKNSQYYGGRYRWFKSGELKDGYITESEETISESALRECSLRLNKPGDVLIAMYGATIGKLAILKTEATTNQAVCACTCFDGFYNRFLFILLRAYKSHFSGQGAGGAQPNISREKIIHTVAPLPPFAEQQRIVSKVDELTRLCDELGARQQEKGESRVRLNKAALAPLSKTASLTRREFEQATARLTENFETLYDSVDTVGKLRSTIRQLAVQGKLTPQDVNDEPASILLNEIEKQREIIQTTKRRARGTVFAKDSVNSPFVIPSAWRWARLEQLAQRFEYGTSEKASLHYDGVPVLRMNNIEDGKVLLSNLKYASPRIKDLPRLYLKTDELLFNRTNSYELVGKTGIFKGESDKFTFASYLIRISLFDSLICPDYVNLAMNADYFRRTQINTNVTQQCGQANFNGTKLANTLIPLPPLAEQKRIVAKVNHLMALCDDLEAKLRQAETDGKRLMDAAVRHVLDVVAGKKGSQRDPALALSSTEM